MTLQLAEVQCPGCRLRLPADRSAAYDGYYHCSAECWGVYSEVLGYEFSNAVIFGQVHQLTVDSYALQHAGGGHKDKSVAIHLTGLYAAFELGLPTMQIPRLLQSIASRTDAWPHLEPPKWMGPLNIFDVALAGDASQHVDRVKKWAQFIWDAWEPHHPVAVDLAENAAD